MTTPIFDFVQNYQKEQKSRFHMPGHKGIPFLGCEKADITEVAGADVLAESAGIIGESQRNAATLFHAGATFFATEGSSQCIKAMLAITLMQWRKTHPDSISRPWILAARNVHRSMIDGCALLDLDVTFIQDEQAESICSCNITGSQVESVLKMGQEKPMGVYLTSPDYLGKEAPVAEIAAICRSYQIPLLVDNAHGAYLAFLNPSRHPMDLGASMCCDSAHKSLPVLTGGAYLHIAKEDCALYASTARKSLTLFGSTSPSYLTLQSLDLCNAYLAKEYGSRLEACCLKVKHLKKDLSDRGIHVMSGEELKLVIDCGAGGYSGEEIGNELRDYNIECEYADGQYLVLMITPENQEEDFARLYQWGENTCLTCQPREPIAGLMLPPEAVTTTMHIRDAVFAPSETIPVSESLGRVLAEETVSCPPAIPIAISGEKITRKMMKMFEKYEISYVSVVSRVVK